MIKGRDLLDVRGNEYIIMKYGKKIQTVTEPTTRIMEPVAKTLSHNLLRGPLVKDTKTKAYNLFV